MTRIYIHGFTQKNMEVNKLKYAFEKERDSLTFLLEKTKESNEYEYFKCNSQNT